MPGWGAGSPTMCHFPRDLLNCCTLVVCRGGIIPVMPGMRAWRSCAVSMVVSAIHPARGFFPSYLRGSADMFRVIHGRQARSTLLCNGAYSRELQQVPWKHGRISAPAYRRARRNVPRFSTSTPTDSAKGPEVVDDEEHEWSSAKVSLLLLRSLLTGMSSGKSCVNLPNTLHVCCIPDVVLPR